MNTRRNATLRSVSSHTTASARSNNGAAHVIEVASLTRASPAANSLAASISPASTSGGDTTENPGDRGLAYEEVSFESDEGLTLHACTSPARTAPP